MQRSSVRPSIALFPIFLVAVGCGSDEPFEAAPPFANEENVRIWATSASALAVYSHGYESFGVADGALSYADAECPTTTDDGTTLTVEGGCTDANAREWKGSATVRRDGSELVFTARDFNDVRGTMLRREVGPSLYEFEAEFVIGGVTTIAYSGTVEGDYAGPSTWNGSGRVERDGFLAPNGAVEATTMDEVVVDARCSGQPVSGSTTLRSRGDTAVVTYDGATDCDSEQNAGHSVNGEDRGLISGINCAVGETGKNRASAMLFPAFAAFALLVARRRRR